MSDGREHPSSKSPPGFYEDMNIPDGPRDGVRWEGASTRTISRLYLSSKSLHGVLEDMENPDGLEMGGYIH